MAGLLAGKVALVTGVSHEAQVGAAVAGALAAEGAALAIASRARDRVEARARDLAAGGAGVLALAVDLTSESEVRKAVEQVASQYGRIDVLVNLAGGLTRYKPAVEVTLDDWNQELGNNLLTAFLCARAVFPRLRDAGGGSIINFARAGLAQANMVAYNCAKAGVEALTRTLALEGRDHNIRVNAVAPGLVDTQSNIEAMKPKDMKKWARKEDVAAAVVFLASDAAAGVTGQTLAVTGWGV
jgi:NAD(P)-dependent dehydrogenase (short-subunit alcohol dehydrogenase family)